MELDEAAATSEGQMTEQNEPIDPLADASAEGSLVIVQSQEDIEVGEDGEPSMETQEAEGQATSGGEMEGSMLVIEGSDVKGNDFSEDQAMEVANQEKRQGTQASVEGGSATQSGQEQSEVEHGRGSDAVSFEDGVTDVTIEGSSGVQTDAIKDDDSAEPLDENGAESVPGAKVAKDEEKEASSLDTSLEIIELDDAQNGDQVDIETLPTADDKKVKDIQTQLKESIMLLQVMNTLAIMGRYLRISTNATADDASLLIRQQEALFDTLKLCDSFSLMMQSFQSGANNILEKLKVAYLYLLDGFPDFAQTDIAAISKDVETMKTAVGKTQNRSSANEIQLKSIKSQVETALADKEAKLKAAEKDLRQLLDTPVPPPPEEEEPRCNFNVKNLSVSLIHGATYYFVYIVLLFVCHDFVFRTARFVTSFRAAGSFLKLTICVVGYVPIRCLRERCIVVLTWTKEDIPEEALPTAAATKAVTEFLWGERTLKERAEDISDTAEVDYSESWEAIRRHNLESVGADTEAGDPVSKEGSKGTLKPRVKPSPETAAKIWELEHEVKNCREVVSRIKLVLEIVKETQALIKSLEGILMASTELVQNWYKECGDIVEPGMAKTVQAVEAMTEQEKMKYWSSLQFKREVQVYYCRWRALQVYQETNRSRLRQIRQQIEGYYTENLLPREALRLSWTLAEKEQHPSIKEICDEHRKLSGAKDERVGLHGIIAATAPAVLASVL